MLYQGDTRDIIQSCVYLDLLNAVDNEHVLQVLHGSVHPVVEGCRPLGKLQVQLVNSLPQFLHTLEHTERVQDSYYLNNNCHCNL